MSVKSTFLTAVEAAQIEYDRRRVLANVIAETIWRAEYRRATGRERTVSWDDGISDNEKQKYIYVACDILANIEQRAELKL